MSDYVSLLGVKGGPAIRPGSNMPTSTLVHFDGKNILIDAGLGASKSIFDQGVPLTEIDAIFITHLHSDHYLELGPLLHTAWTAGRTQPIQIYGPSRLTHYWTHFLRSLEDDIRLRIEDEGRTDIAQLFAFEALADGQQMTWHEITIKVMRNSHPPIEDSFALRFEGTDNVIVLSGDTAYMAEMAPFAAKADLLIHEVMLLEGVDAIMKRQPNADERLRHHLLRSHCLAEDVGRIATEAQVKRLALNHFVPDGFAAFTKEHWTKAIRTTWDGALLISYDGMKIHL